MTYNALLILPMFCFIMEISAAHPAFRAHFDKIVNSDECLRSCMDPIQSHNEELSLLKNADLVRYFENHDRVCELISEARECIDRCGVKSNPFALESMTSHCTQQMKNRVNMLRQCLLKSGENIIKQCTTVCGDYHALNDEVHRLTMESQDDAHNPETLGPILLKTDQACATFKCMARCNRDSLANACGKHFGAEMQELVQVVLDAQRRDLEKLNIVHVMAQNTPPQCNYMYEPGVVFNVTKDREMLAIMLHPEHNMHKQLAEIARRPQPAQLQAQRQQVQQDVQQVQQKPQLPPSVAAAVNDVVARSQLRILMKQLELMQRQEALLEKENAKLDLEMSLLARKQSLQREPQQMYS